MSTGKPRRRPPLSKSLPLFLPSLIAVLVAIWIPQPYERYSLLLLLIGASLSMAAVCHAIGFACEPGFSRIVFRRGPAHLIALAIHTAIVFALTAWPLLVLSHASSLAGALGLAVALAVAIAVLWRSWPVFGLVFEWDDAFPASAEHSWITASLARSLRFARHLTRAHDLFLTHLLPAALAQLVIAFGALTLAGIGADLPDEIRTAALFLYAVLVLPVCSLIVANRTLRLLFGGRVQRAAPPPLQPPPRAPETGPDSPGQPDEGSSPVARPAAPAEPALPQPELDEELLETARAGDTEKALAWLQRGADPNATPLAGAHDQRSALMLAAVLPDTHLLRALIAHGADLNRRHGGMTALLAAARDGCRESAEGLLVLVANGADLAATDADGNTALHFAARNPDPANALTLIDAGAPLDACNLQKLTPLCVAGRAANWPMLELLLQRGARVHVQGSEPALVAASGIFTDDPRGVAALLRHKADVNARDGQGRTALMDAAREGHGGIGRALIEARADVNAADQHGTTALMEAARAGMDALIVALGAAGAATGPRDRHGRDAMTLACQSPHARAATVRALADLHADPRAAGPDRRSALDHAMAAGRWDLVAALDPDQPVPACLALPESPDPGANTPAHLLDILRFGHWTMVPAFAPLVRDWPSPDVAGLYLELCEPEHRAARDWLFDHGLAADARLGDGRGLFEALLERLPGSIDALGQLAGAGASTSGAGLLARALPRLHDSASAARFALELLTSGTDAFGADASGRTPLHHCTHPALEPLQRDLLRRGADANARDRQGTTPLHLVLHAARACESTREHAGMLPLVRNLIAHGADAEATDASGETPLGAALMLGDRDLEYWLDWAHWQLPRRPLRADDLPDAAGAGDLAAVDKLLRLGFPVDARNSDGATALICACNRGHLPVVARLLEARADAAAPTPDGTTALAAAACADHIELIALLAERGAPIDQRLPGDATALLLVCALGHPVAAGALLGAGASVNAADAQGRSALHAAAHYCFSSDDSLRCQRLLETLLRHRADANGPDRKGNSPLGLLLGARMAPGVAGNETHLAALMPALLDAGAAPGRADDRGVTPLHACAMHALFAPARALLARGADREACDCMGRTPADVACALGFVDLALELAPRRAAPLSPRGEASLTTPPH